MIPRNPAPGRRTHGRTQHSPVARGPLQPGGPSAAASGQPWGLSAGQGGNPTCIPGPSGRSACGGQPGWLTETLPTARPPPQRTRKLVHNGLLPRLSCVWGGEEILSIPGFLPAFGVGEPLSPLGQAIGTQPVSTSLPSPPPSLHPTPLPPTSTPRGLPCVALDPCLSGLQDGQERQDGLGPGRGRSGSPPTPPISRSEGPSRQGRKGTVPPQVTGSRPCGRQAGWPSQHPQGSRTALPRSGALPPRTRPHGPCSSSPACTRPGTPRFSLCPGAWARPPCFPVRPQVEEGAAFPPRPQLLCSQKQTPDPKRVLSYGPINPGPCGEWGKMGKARS